MMTRLWGVRWWMMGLLMVGSIINYLTRSTLAVAAPTVLKDLAISEQQYSWILPNFTGSFVGMACQDLAGTARPADFDWFAYRERPYVVDVSQLELL